MSASNGVAQLLDVKGHFIDGAFVAPASKKTLPVENPATAETIAQIPVGNADDIDRAVKAARRSFDKGDWSRADPSHRGRVLWALAAAIRANAETLAQVETRDCGKPIAEARIDIAGTADIIEYYAGLATKIFGQTMPLPGKQTGWFWEPTVLAEVPEGAAVMNEEPFGPIAPFAKVASFDEAIERANRLDYGFAAYLFTASLKTAALAQSRLRAGNIGINQMSPTLPDSPVGGMVASGYGYEGGRAGIEAFLHFKLVSQTWS